MPPAILFTQSRDRVLGLLSAKKGAAFRSGASVPGLSANADGGGDGADVRQSGNRCPGYHSSKADNSEHSHHGIDAIRGANGSGDNHASELAASQVQRVEIGEEGRRYRGASNLPARPPAEGSRAGLQPEAVS